MGFPPISHSARKCNSGEIVGNWYSYFSCSMCAFFPNESHPMVYFITWDIQGYSYQFLISWKDAAKPNLWGRPWIKIPMFFPKYGYFSSNIFPPYGILYHVKNAWVFSSISITWTNEAKFVLWEDLVMGTSVASNSHNMDGAWVFERIFRVMDKFS